MDDILSAFKEGIKTSEFWLAFLVAAFTAAQQAWRPDLPWQAQVSTVGMAVVAAAYAFSRTWLKRKRLDALEGVAPAAKK